MHQKRYSAPVLLPPCTSGVTPLQFCCLHAAEALLRSCLVASMHQRRYSASVLLPPCTSGVTPLLFCCLHAPEALLRSCIVAFMHQRRYAAPVLLPSCTRGVTPPLFCCLNAPEALLRSCFVASMHQWRYSAPVLLPPRVAGRVTSECSWKTSMWTRRSGCYTRLRNKPLRFICLINLSLNPLFILLIITNMMLNIFTVVSV